MRHPATLAIPVAVAALPAIATPASARRVPPQRALPLSQIIAGVEKADNRSSSIRVDPMTGEPWTRRR
jgi:hypothetical protein